MTNNTNNTNKPKLPAIRQDYNTPAPAGYRSSWGGMLGNQYVKIDIDHDILGKAKSIREKLKALKISPLSEDERMNYEISAITAMRMARANLIFDYPFYGSMAMTFVLRPTWRIPTLATDGRTIAFNPYYVSHLTKAQQRTVMAHETLHNVCMHHLRRGKRDPKLWNDAGDYVINNILLQEGFSLTDGALINTDYANMSTDEVYALLAQENPPPPQGGGKDKQKGGGEGERSHKDAMGEGEDISDDDTFDPHNTGHVEDMRDEMERELTETQKAQAEQQMREKIASAEDQAKRYGDMSAALTRILKDVTATPERWEEILRAFVRERVVSDLTWRRPNRRMLSMDMSLPSPEIEVVGKIVLLMDTSGSIDQETMSHFQNETNAIISEVVPSSVDVVWFAEDVKHVEHYERGDPIKLESRWSGGTSFDEPFQYCDNLDEPPLCVIMFTDLEVGRFPKERDYPVVFANYNRADPDKKAPWGLTVGITK